MSSYSSEVTKKRCHLDLCVQTSGSLFSTCLIQLQIVNQTLSLVLQVVVGWLVSCFEGTKNCLQTLSTIRNSEYKNNLKNSSNQSFQLLKQFFSSLLFFYYFLFSILLSLKNTCLCFFPSVIKSHCYLSQRRNIFIRSYLCYLIHFPQWG